MPIPHPRHYRSKSRPSRQTEMCQPHSSRHAFRRLGSIGQVPTQLMCVFAQSSLQYLFRLSAAVSAATDPARSVNVRIKTERVQKLRAMCASRTTSGRRVIAHLGDWTSVFSGPLEPSVEEKHQRSPELVKNESAQKKPMRIHAVRRPSCSPVPAVCLFKC